MITKILRMVLLVSLVCLLALSINRPVLAGTNGQQLRINVCYAQSIRIIGSNQNGQRQDISYNTNPDKCVTIETTKWWWKGTLRITVNYPDTTYQYVGTIVPINQKDSDWWNITIKPLPAPILRGYVWIKNNVKYGSFDKDPNNDYYSAVDKKYSNRPLNSTYYRTDCSGFVSYAWNLEKSLDTVALGKIAKSISYIDLQPGDIINNNQAGAYGHVILFVRWIDKSNLEFWAYEESGGQGTVLSTMRLVVDKNGKIIELKKQYGSTFSTYGNAPWYAQKNHEA